MEGAANNEARSTNRFDPTTVCTRLIRKALENMIKQTEEMETEALITPREEHLNCLGTMSNANAIQPKSERHVKCDKSEYSQLGVQGTDWRSSRLGVDGQRRLGSTVGSSAGRTSRGRTSRHST